MTAHDDRPPEQKVNVLLVDDQPANLLALEAVLDHLQQNLVRAQSGEEALQKLQADDFAVVLLDVQMPGLGGFETAKLIRGRERSRHTPIIFVTAYDNTDLTAVEAYRLGAVDYLVKPLVPDILRAKVTGFVELHQKTEQVRRQGERLRQLERQELERQLAERSLRRFKSVIEHSYDAVALLDAAGAITYARPSTARVLGYPAEEFTGRNAFDLMHPDDLERTRGLMAGLLREPGGSVTATFRYRHRDGSWRWMEGTGTNLLDDPDVLAVVSNYRDITEQVEAARRKDEWISMLAHELRGPLSPVSIAVQVLVLKGQDDPELEQARDVIARQTRHLSRIVDGLLEVTRLIRGEIRLQKSRQDLARLVRASVEDHRAACERAGLTPSLEVPETPVWVEGDPTRLAQVIGNLLDNAVKFKNGGDRVEVNLKADREHGQAVLAVRGRGIGIEPELLPVLFDVFAQADRTLSRQRGGLGLGLAVVRGLVQLHGGEVRAASAGAGRGSEFTVLLPLGREPAALAEVPASPDPAALRLRILVVEDNRDAADRLQLLLSLMGHEVRAAYTGPDGVREAVAWTPEVIISDIGLPGLDGYGLAGEVRRNPATAGARLIAITGYGGEEERRRALASGFDFHLTKPAEFAELRRVFAG